MPVPVDAVYKEEWLFTEKGMAGQTKNQNTIMLRLHCVKKGEKSG